MATHSSIIAWRIPWTEEPGKLQSQESWTQLSYFHTSHIQKKKKSDIGVSSYNDKYNNNKHNPP